MYFGASPWTTRLGLTANPAPGLNDLSAQICRNKNTIYGPIRLGMLNKKREVVNISIIIG